MSGQKDDRSRDPEVIRRYKDGESQRGIARELGVTRGFISRCLDRNKIAKRPRPPGWTDEEKQYLISLCNSGVSGQAVIPFFPTHSYSAIKHQKDVLRMKRLI